MDAVLSVHGRVGYALVLYYTAVGIWGLALWLRRAGPSANFRGAIAIAVIASAAQGALGLAVTLFGAPPRDPLHLLYGVALVVAMPLGASLVGRWNPPRQALGLGLAALFTAGLAIRGIITA
jgi:hypothetical protein